ncbi:hypothetical protein [Domibacillus enclensis]|uniref:YxiS n=1 Tax=Domibacillus enclensis TaxID=1017273 RepID=A0A1N6NYN1_9BACI|nr:hypothetical protein [Domibacillus enclensis]OXS80184.1 hypothetical protein B1B05_01520 [Domibacillus enclensis]SIP97235.1 hypothetical protein SAMN05443094_101321 [Domibacillus enclensis]
MSKEMEEFIIQSYQKEENMMILVFAQWCVNHDLDPVDLYQKAYPDQVENQALSDGIALTVPKEEAGDVPDDTLLGVLSLFGNEDLAFVVTQEIEKRKRS